MPDPEKKEPESPFNDGQDGGSQPSEPPKDPGKKPDKPKGGDEQGDKVSKKQYDEAHAKITKISQENAELRRKIDEFEAGQKAKEPAPKQDKLSFDEQLQKQLERTKVVRQKAEDEGYDTTHYDNDILMLEEKIAERQAQVRQRHIQSDFDNFLNYKDGDGNYTIMKELDSGLYTIQDLNEIKAKAKKATGFDIDYESARARFLANNMAKYQEYDKKRREDAERANSPDGDPAAEKKKDAEKEFVKNLFPDMSYDT